MARKESFALAALLLLLAGGQPALAQTVTATSSASNDLSCVADRTGISYNCSAGEFTTLVSFALPPTNATTCVAGEYTTISLVATLSGTNADRYDGGIYVGQAANNPGLPGGQCSVARFPLTSTQTPLLKGFVGSLEGAAADACGDYRAAGIENWQVDNIKVLCNANTSGQLQIPYLLTYQQNDPGTCSGDSSLRLVPGTTSKCNSGNASVPAMSVQGWVRVIKQTNPDGASGTFNFSASGPAASNVSPANFSLGDGQEQQVLMTLAGSSNRTLTITESATAGWEPTASITCTNPTGGSASYVTVNNGTRTITANLNNVNYGAICTVTNTRQTRVRTIKSLNPTGDAGRFNLSAGGSTVANQGHGGTTGYVAVTAGASQTFSETAGTGTVLGDYISTYQCVNDTSGATVASGTGTTVSLTPTAQADTTCTFTNTRRARLTVTKSALGAGATFPFVLSGGINDATFQPNVGNGSSVARIYAGVTPGQNITITENPPNPANWTLASINCTNAVGAPTGSAISTTIVNNYATELGHATVNLVSGADVNCTFTNSRNIDLVIVKNAVGGNTSVAYRVADAGNNATIATPSLTTIGGTGSASASVPVPNGSSRTFDVIETVPAGYALTGISCSANSGSFSTVSVNLATATARVTASSGASGTCTFTNVRKPNITIRKQTAGGFGAFSFSGGTNGLPGSLGLTTSSGSNPASSTAFAVTDVTQDASLTEVVPAGWNLTGWSCTNASNQQVASGSTATMIVPSSVLDDGNDLVCTFSNSKQPVLRLQKSLPNGRFNAGDQFNLAISGAGGSSVVTSGTGSTASGTVVVSPATIGANYAFSETAAAGASLGNYDTSWSCSNASGGQAPSGNGTSFNVTPAAGDDLTCTLVNTRHPKADLSVTKTDNQVSVATGSQTTYVITASNSGPDAADGAVLQDPVQSGLSCTSVTCSASGGAACPGSPTVADLQGSGVSIPLFPAGSSVTFQLTCTVTASGQ